MRRQYEELKESLDFNNAELTSLKKENNELKDKVSSLEKSLSEVRADVDILYEDLGTAITQVDDVEQYTRKHNFVDYGGLLAAIPKDWKNAILHGNQEYTNEPKVTQLTIGNVSAKHARLMFAEKTFCLPLTESYLREQTFTPSAVYELPFKITIENKLRSFQFKLIHNILPTNQRLWKINVKSSP